MERAINYKDQRWEQAQHYSWMTPKAWAVIEAHREDIEPWVLSAGDNPKHHRLMLHAVHYRLTDFVRCLLDAGASPHIQSYDEEGDEKQVGKGSVFSPLYRSVSACYKPYDPKLFDLLLDRGADPHETTFFQMTHPSLMAAAIDDPVALSDMLARGYSADMKTHPMGQGGGGVYYTALHRVCQYAFDKHTPRHSRRRVARLLVNAGADLTTPFGRFNAIPCLVALRHNPELAPIVFEGMQKKGLVDYGQLREQLRDMVDTTDDPRQHFSAALKKLSQIEADILNNGIIKGRASIGKPRL